LNIMKFSIKSAAIFSALSLLVVSPFAVAGSASAQQISTRGMEGSYLGGGVSVGVNNPNDDATVGGNVQVRLDAPQAPVSLRGAALIGGDSTAIMPTLTYDAAIARNTNLYGGVGYSFVTDKGNTSPLGDKNSVVLTAGVETAVQRNIALYGDVKVGLDAFQNSNDAAVSTQLGVGYRF
jgi:Outer membrane protein beta-barrel domain